MAKVQLPYAPEAELAVLGGILANNGVADLVFEQLSPSDFKESRHALVAAAMRELHRRGSTIDPVTIFEELSRTGKIEQAGGAAYLGEIMEVAPEAANVQEHVRIVADRSLRRRLYEAAGQIAADAVSPMPVSLDELIDRAERRILQVADRKKTDGPRPVQETLMDAIELIEGGGVEGVPSGIHAVDKLTGGWKPGSLYVIAGATSMGKSAFGLQSVAYAAIDQQVPSAIFSIEMTRLENTVRLLAIEGMLDLHAMLNGDLQDHDLPKLEHAGRRLAAAKLVLDDTATRVSEIRARARRIKRDHGLGLILVDHIHDMNEVGETRREQLGMIGRGLKQLAKELGVPILALSQLSRAPTTRPDRRPQLSDLRESGDIEAAADAVILMYRPEYYFGPKDQEGKDIRGRAEAIVAKNRNGPTGRVDLYFRAECARFESLAREDMRGVA